MVADLLVTDMHKTYENVVLQIQVIMLKIDVHGVTSFVLDYRVIGVFGNQLISRSILYPGLKPEDLLEGRQILNIYSV